MEGIVWFMLIWQTAILPDNSTADARLLVPRVTYNREIDCKIAMNDMVNLIEREEAREQPVQVHVYGKCITKAPDSFYVELLDIVDGKINSTFVTQEVPPNDNDN